MDYFVNRFDDRSQCQHVVLDFSYYFLFGEYPDFEENKRCKSIVDICRFFIKKNVSVVCHCNLIFFLNPMLTYIVIRSMFSSRKKNKSSRYVIITFSSAIELYGIRDIWNHYICETFDGEKYMLYDPYYPYIEEDYGIKLPRLTRNILSKAKKFQILLWIEE